MRVTIISTSRADAGSLEPVYDALVGAGHGVDWLDVDPERSTDGVNSAPHAASSVIGFVTDSLVRSAPDLVVLLGDRYETLAAAAAAFLMGLPIAHLSGGDVTEGSQDDSMRHAITKLSHLHFATHKESANRIIQMGEDPSRVHVTGCPGVDSLLKVELLTKEVVMAKVGLVGVQNYFLISLHPNSLTKSDRELNQLLGALDIQRKRVALTDEPVGFVLTDPNKDDGYRLIEDKFKTYAENKRVVYCQKLDRQVYLSLMAHCIALVGNSSVGFYEAPSLDTKVINIGDRQKGRIPSMLLRDCPPNVYDIYGLMREAELRKWPWGGSHNPYGDGKASERIVNIISSIKDPKSLLRKKFYTQTSTQPEMTPYQVSRM